MSDFCENFLEMCGKMVWSDRHPHSKKVDDFLANTKYLNLLILFSCLFALVLSCILWSLGGMNFGIAFISHFFVGLLFFACAQNEYFLVFCVIFFFPVFFIFLFVDFVFCSYLMRKWPIRDNYTLNQQFFFKPQELEFEDVETQKAIKKKNTSKKKSKLPK